MCYTENVNTNILEIISIALGVIGILYIIYNIIKSIRKGEFGLDVLALIAIISTLIVGEYIASAIVTIMVFTGEFLEEYAAKQAEKELTKLISAIPKIAHKIVNDDFTHTQTEDIDIDTAKIGDFLQVLPHEVIPIDGECVTKTTVDESSLTGESLPVEKNVGDTVLSGSVSMQLCIIKTTVLASDSAYQKISELADKAKDSQPHYVKLANTIAIPFTIISLLIAVIAVVLTNDPIRFAEVLVLATPCPLLIAAPVSYLAGLSKAAQSGIIIKSGQIIERLNRSKIIAFDKTGTLTNGKPEFDHIEITEKGVELNFDDEKVLQVLSSVEAKSTHILATSIVNKYFQSYKNAQLLKCNNLTELVGKGVSADIEIKWLEEGRNLHVWAQKPSHEMVVNPGETAVELLVNGHDIAHVILKDHLRSHVRETLEQLRKIGVQRMIMLTGDNAQTANYIAENAGIIDVRSSLLPHQKQEAIYGLMNSCVLHPNCKIKADSELKLQKLRNPHVAPAVTMIGDGVNDSLVLMSADIGIAFGAKGSSAATQSADIVLEKDDFRLVGMSFKIAKRTMKIAKQSMIGGIGISIILMIVAGFGFIPAIAGALLQEVVDVLAICNGLRAKFYRKY